MAEASSSDFILCQITSQSTKDNKAILLKTSDFESGSLQQDSYIRPNRIFTANDKIILYKAAHLKPIKLDTAIDGIVQILKGQ